MSISANGIIITKTDPIDPILNNDFPQPVYLICIISYLSKKT
jgi:hypothetical protein